MHRWDLNRVEKGDQKKLKKEQNGGGHCTTVHATGCLIFVVGIINVTVLGRLEHIWRLVDTNLRYRTFS
jgi:hypothetical protein